MENNLFIAPSMMCADFKNLENEINELNNTSMSCYHIDIMDGDFVPNFGVGMQDLETIIDLSSKLVDVHLMVKNPKNHIALFAEKGVDIIYFHPEVDEHPIRTIENIRRHKITPGIAISTQTTIESVKYLLPYVDYVMIMSVVPGFAGQSFLEITEDKVNELMKYKGGNNFVTVMDGAISPDVIAKYYRMGVSGFVLGTSTLFGKNESYKEIINGLSQLI